MAPEAADWATLTETAEHLIGSGQRKQAIALYRDWLEQTDSPLAYVIRFNLAVALSDAGRHDEALRAYREVIGTKPDFIQAYLNLGTLLERRGQVDEAMRLWRFAADLPGDDTPAGKGLRALALNNLGRVLENLSHLDEASAMLEQSLALDPGQPEVIQHWVHLRQKQCLWPVYPARDDIPLHRMLQATSPLALLGLSDNPRRQIEAAERFVRQRLPAEAEPPLCPLGGYRHERLRIGYLSSDFCLHPVSLLTAELFELHDRAAFEIHGFCWSREDGSPLRRRVVDSFDHYVPVGGMDDRAAAECIRAREIDLLIDLQGLTSGARPRILSLRPAPVQAGYLGFPGTSALPGVDYIIADRFVLPESAAGCFSEKPAWLPRVFQVSDRQRPVGPTPDRASCGLPDEAFVFCSFNNNHKITPEVFAAWMNILRRVPGSVLWLLADNPWARDNLRRQAENHGLSGERLVFAGRTSPEAYLARYPLADLFLDTFPFNGGATANDALWMGVPLLTCAGSTFASRMGGSLLHALGLDELIVANLADYEEKAVGLARGSRQLAAIREALADGRRTSALFDVPGLVRELEDLYRRIAVRA